MLKFIFLATALLFISTSIAHAESKDIVEWNKKQKIFEDWYANDPDGCNKVFTAVWKDAEKGDLNARFYLLVQMTMMHGADMNLPSPSADYLTRHRQYIIMSAHSIGSTLDNEGTADKKYYTDIILQTMDNISPLRDFEDCLQKDRSPECVKLAVKDGFLPSFEDFAKEIDLYIKAGYTAKCPGNDHWKEERKFQDRLK